MRNQLLSRKYLKLVESPLTEFKLVRDTPSIRGSADVWFFWVLMTGSALTTSKTHLLSLCNDNSTHLRLIAYYVDVTIQLL